MKLESQIILFSVEDVIPDSSVYKRHKSIPQQIQHHERKLLDYVATIQDREGFKQYGSRDIKDAIRILVPSILPRIQLTSIPFMICDLLNRVVVLRTASATEGQLQLTTLASKLIPRLANVANVIDKFTWWGRVVAEVKSCGNENKQLCSLGHQLSANQQFQRVHCQISL